MFDNIRSYILFTFLSNFDALLFKYSGCLLIGVLHYNIHLFNRNIGKQDNSVINDAHSMYLEYYRGPFILKDLKFTNGSVKSRRKS